MPRIRKIVINLILMFSVIIICLIAIEIYFRYTNPADRHELGWYPCSNCTLTITRQDTDNVSRIINVSYYDNGFKRWGDLSTNKTRIFVIGDSFVEMQYVSNGEEWYSYLEGDGVELWVFGSGGYGTYQELLVFEKYHDIIEPDIVIWQMYFNDWINNDFDSEIGEYPMSNHGFRPYLEDGKTVVRFPGPYSSLRNFRSGELLMNMVDRSAYEESSKMDPDTFYHIVYGDKFWERDFAESKIFNGEFYYIYQNTKRMFERAVNQSGAQFFMISADPRLVPYEKLIAEQSGMTYIPGIAEMIEDMESGGIQVLSVNDCHWNLLGNRLVGEHIVSFFNRNGILSDNEKTK